MIKVEGQKQPYREASNENEAVKIAARNLGTGDLTSTQDTNMSGEPIFVVCTTPKQTESGNGTFKKCQFFKIKPDQVANKEGK